MNHLVDGKPVPVRIYNFVKDFVQIPANVPPVAEDIILSSLSLYVAYKITYHLPTLSLSDEGFDYVGDVEAIISALAETQGVHIDWMALSLFMVDNAAELMEGGDED